MNEELDRTEQFVRHLSGELTQNDLNELEQKILEDDDLFESCMAVEAELVDAWIRGELPRSQASELSDLLGASSRLQNSFQTTLALDARAPGKPEPSAEEGRLDLPTNPRVTHWPGLLMALVLGAALGGYGYRVFVQDKLNKAQADLQSVSATLEQVEEELRQAEETNNILEVELAREEARERQ